MRTKFYLMTVLFLFLLSFPAGARVRLYIQSPPIVSAIPLFWMEEKGCLDEEIDFKVIVSSGHQAGLSLIYREEIQMLVTGVNVGARAYNAGIGINLLNVNVWGIDYLLTYGFKADSWKDLKGKTLCLPLKGGPLDFVVRYLIGKTEIDIEEINLVYKPLPQGAKYFQMGELDAIVLPEPLVTITLKNTPQAKLSLDIQKEWAKYHQNDRRIPFVGLFASSTFLEQHPELTEEFRLLYLEGVRWVNQNQKEAAELAGKHLKIPPDILEEAFHRIHFECIASQECRDRVQGYLEEILKIYPELIYGRLPDEEFYQ